MSPKRLTSDSYRVGWICPSEIEQIAALEMLDEDDIPEPQIWLAGWHWRRRAGTDRN